VLTLPVLLLLLQGVVRDFARQMGSVSTLVRDATLPLLSYFSGAAFEEALQRSFSQGPGEFVS
jgi:lysophospholipid hydrolase